MFVSNQKNSKSNSIIVTSAFESEVRNINYEILALCRQLKTFFFSIFRGNKNGRRKIMLEFFCSRLKVLIESF